MTARNDRKASVSLREPIRIVKYLDIPFVPFSEIDRIRMTPMVVVLMEAKPSCAARGNVHRGMAEVIIGTNRGFGAAL